MLKSDPAVLEALTVLNGPLYQQVLDGSYKGN